MSAPGRVDSAATKRQLRTALFAVLGICFMTGVAWASIPLYRLFCQVTGLNGTTQRGLEAPGAVSARLVVPLSPVASQNRR